MLRIGSRHNDSEPGTVVTCLQPIGVMDRSCNGRAVGSAAVAALPLEGERELLQALPPPVGRNQNLAVACHSFDHRLHDVERRRRVPDRPNRGRGGNARLKFLVCGGYHHGDLGSNVEGSEPV